MPMNVLNRIIVATIPAVPKLIVRKFANRYIAGEEITDAVRVVKELNGRGIMATVDVLGEDISRREEAIGPRDKILEVLEAIRHDHLDSNVSIKLTQLGLKLDHEFCLSNVRTIAQRARELGNFVRIDMEDSTCTDETLRIYREIRKEFTNIGIVLQGYLRRTPADAEALMRDGLNNFRLCKGIYIEPEEIAYKGHGEINDNYLRVLGAMLRGKAYVGIATHDDQLIAGARKMVRELGLTNEKYEFQMLLGVKPELHSMLVREGHRLRIYVPFGKHWYNYSIRRFKENPQVAGYVFKALFSRAQYN